ncbi:MAG: anthranilate phosphoribosyltransferase [Phototrophicaceae bacterium]|jgi:anthranilate phosphoribosyltransferase
MTEMTIQRALDMLGKFGHLQADEAEAVMNQIMAGNATESQIAAYLMALRMKGETPGEIVGSARAMRQQAHRVPTLYSPDDLLDTCGTGGDKSGTFNISTTVAFVAAAVGVPVAKHGNRAASSKAGSADVLEALGVNINLSAEQVGQCVDQIGIGFLFARTLHPAMKYVAAPRRDMAIRTIFNILGPLTNPAGAKRQLMGVFSADLTPLLAHVLGELGAISAMVVSGYGGLDELTTTGENTISHYQNGKVDTYDLDPQSFGFSAAPIADLLGGTAEENAAILRGILDGSISGAKRDVVLLNAGAALVVAGKAQDIPNGIQLADDAINSGAALGKLNDLVHLSQAVSA